MLDRVQVLAILARASHVGSGMFVVILSAVFLSVQDQGYVFTFSSLVAIQVLAEMGLTNVLLQFAARESAHVKWVVGRIEGQPEAVARIGSLARLALMWFGIGGGALAAGLVIGGLYFFSASGGLTHEVTLAWIALAIFVPANLVLVATFSLLEGLAKVGEVAKVRLCQVACGGGLATVVAAAHHGLFLPAALQFGMLIVGVPYMVYRMRALLENRQQSGGISWRREIFPFQWRIAISWVSGYAVFQLMTPVVFRFAGPEAAGRLGMSHQLLTASSSICAVVVSAKTAQLAESLVRGDALGFERSYLRAALVSLLLLCGAVFIVVALAFVSSLGPSNAISGRLLAPSAMGFLAAACLIAHVVTLAAMYVRLHLAEPFVWASVANAASMLLLLSLLVPRSGAEGAAEAYFFTNVLVSLPLAGVIFWRFRARREMAYARQG